jgi:hypothetical protein
MYKEETFTLEMPTYLEPIAEAIEPVTYQLPFIYGVLAGIVIAVILGAIFQSFVAWLYNIGHITVTKNKNRAFGSADSYKRVKCFLEGKKEYLLLTPKQLDSIRQRVVLNPEDVKRTILKK